MSHPSAPREQRTVLVATLVHGAACHLCDDAEAALAEMATRVPMQVERIYAMSSAGRQMLLDHRAGLLPLLLIDGKFVSSGRVPRGELRRIEADMLSHASPTLGEVI